MIETILSFVVVIGVLVFIHELGHFLTAKWTGMRADVFAIGMGPRLFGWNWKKGFTFGAIPADLDLEGRTDYRLCALPIGGYVKIVGMIDESFDTDHLETAPEPYEFRSKKNWQKAIVLSAGVIMNSIFAILVLAALPYVNGHEEHRTTTIAYVEPNSLASMSGLRAGDRILRIDGREIETWEDMADAIALRGTAGTRMLDVERNGLLTKAEIRSDEVLKALSNGGLGMEPLGWRVAFQSVVTLAAAGKAGFLTGDQPKLIDSTPVVSPTQFRTEIRAHANKSILLTVNRDGKAFANTVTVGSDSTIGVMLDAVYVGDKKYESFGLGESLLLGVNDFGNTFGMIGVTISSVVRGKVAAGKAFGGPITIAQQASRSAKLGVEPFLRFMALISISLAFMNLLPIPGLDGGHLVIVLVESVLRRELATSTKMRIQQVGVGLLLLLMGLIIFLEVKKNLGF